MQEKRSRFMLIKYMHTAMMVFTYLLFQNLVVISTHEFPNQKSRIYFDQDKIFFLDYNKMRATWPLITNKRFKLKDNDPA